MNFLYSIAIICNLVVISMYWTLIHSRTIVKYKTDGGPYVRVVCQYAVHAIPAIVCLSNTIITNTLMSARLIPPIVGIGSIYMVVNFITVKMSGEPIYDFLTWEDWRSPLIATLLITGFIFVYLILSMLD